MFIDSHCHLHLIDYEKLGITEDEAVDNAVKDGIEHMLCVATSLSQFDKLKLIANKYNNVSISIGLHPNDKEIDFSLEKLINLANDKDIVAIGETGLDYYRTSEKNEILEQQQKFITHIKVAKKTNKPLIVHTRLAKEDTINILKKEGNGEVKGVIHCFTEDLDMALRCIELGFYISFSGIISFRNAEELQDVVRQLPLDKMLIETDSPYLAPVPMRGKINQPSYVKFVAEAISKLKNVSIEEVAGITTKNYYELFFKK